MKKNVPFITYGVIGVCLLVWAGVNLLGWENTSEAAVFLGAFYKPLIYAGEWWRLITVSFVHISAMHLFVNCWSMSILGKALERMLGHLRFALLFFGSVLGGSLFLLALKGNPVTVGCSAGLFGMMSAYIYLIALAGGLAIPAVRNSVMMTLMINLAINLMPGVSVGGHMGGAITGLLLIFALQKHEGNPGMRRNASLALVALCAALIYMIRTNTYIPKDERYLLTDYTILKAEEKYGFGSHAYNAAERLDALYQENGSFLTYYLTGGYSNE